MFYEMVLAIALASIVLAILVPSKRYDVGSGVLTLVFFFPLLFLLIWLVGAWLTPMGPPIAGVYWIGFAVPALLLLLLLFALSHPSGPPRQKGDVVPENAEEEARAGTIVAFSWFFWLLIVISIVGLVVRYA